MALDQVERGLGVANDRGIGDAACAARRGGDVVGRALPELLEQVGRNVVTWNAKEPVTRSSWILQPGKCSRALSFGR